MAAPDSTFDKVASILMKFFPSGTDWNREEAYKAMVQAGLMQAGEATQTTSKEYGIVLSGEIHTIGEFKNDEEFARHIERIVSLADKPRMSRQRIRTPDVKFSWEEVEQ